MNIAQIKYFLEVAKCLNFSEAARHLYITQPTLCRQMTSIESELNMQLFIRSTKGLRLTPAGIVLQEEWSKALEVYENGITMANKASWGYKGSLKIGVANGLCMGEKFRSVLSSFRDKYPNIRVELFSQSFLTLLENYRQGKLDMIISFDFHIGNESMSLVPFDIYHPAWIVPKANPLSEREHVSFADFRDQDLVIVNAQECATGVQLIIDLCEQMGGFYPNLYYVEKMEDVFLWLQSGEKCALLNMECDMVKSDLVKIYPLENDPNKNLILVGYNSNSNNFSLSLFIDEIIHKTSLCL